MAKTKDKDKDQFEYYFVLVEPNHVRISKMSLEGDLLVTYNVKGNLRGQCSCDCPGSWHAKSDQDKHKHVLWTRRYMKLRDSTPTLSDPGRYVYYSTKEDTFRTGTVDR